MSDERKTNPSLRVVRPSVPPATITPGREPTNAELAIQMESLGKSFDEHREEDKQGFQEVKKKTDWQTFIIGFFLALAHLISALAR